MRHLSVILLRSPSIFSEEICVIQILLWQTVINRCFRAITFSKITAKIFQFSHLDLYFRLQHLVSHFQTFQTFDLLGSFVDFSILRLHFLSENVVLHFLLRKFEPVLMSDLGRTEFNLASLI